MKSTTVRTISEAHAWLINNVIWCHSDITTEDGEKTWEGESASVTIKQPLMNMIHPLSSFQQQRCDEYAKQLIEGVETDIEPNRRFSYTYHERLYLESQYDDVISRLKENPETRRAVLYTWLPEIDSTSEEVPCLQMLHYGIRKGRLDCKSVFRSNDVLSAAGPNMYAIAMLQNSIADELEVGLGEYTHDVDYPHIYPVRDAEDLKRWM